MQWKKEILILVVIFLLVLSGTVLFLYAKNLPMAEYFMSGINAGNSVDKNVATLDKMMGSPKQDLASEIAERIVILDKMSESSKQLTKEEIELNSKKLDSMSR